MCLDHVGVSSTTVVIDSDSDIDIDSVAKSSQPSAAAAVKQKKPKSRKEIFKGAKCVVGTFQEVPLLSQCALF